MGCSEEVGDDDSVIVSSDICLNLDNDANLDVVNLVLLLISKVSDEDRMEGALGYDISILEFGFSVYSLSLYSLSK